VTQGVSCLLRLKEEARKGKRLLTRRKEASPRRRQKRRGRPPAKPGKKPAQGREKVFAEGQPKRRLLDVRRKKKKHAGCPSGWIKEEKTAKLRGRRGENRAERGRGEDALTTRCDRGKRLIDSEDEIRAKGDGGNTEVQRGEWKRYTSRGVPDEKEKTQSLKKRKGGEKKKPIDRRAGDAKKKNPATPGGSPDGKGGISLQKTESDQKKKGGRKNEPIVRAAKETPIYPRPWKRGTTSSVERRERTHPGKKERKRGNLCPS